MSTLNLKNIQLGNNPDPSKNFVLSVPAVADGTVKLARGDAGATTQDILTVDASGNVNVTVGIKKAGSALQALSDFTGTNASLAASGYQKLPGGLIIQWGSGSVSAVANTNVSTAVTFPVAFPGAVLRVLAVPNNSNSTTFLTMSAEGASVSGFNIVCGSGLSGQRSFSYFAIGY